MKTLLTCPACKADLVKWEIERDILNIVNKTLYNCQSCLRIWKINGAMKTGLQYEARNMADFTKKYQDYVIPKRFKPNTLLSYCANPAKLPLVQQFELQWDIIAAWMNDARQFSNELFRYRSERAKVEMNRLYQLITQGLIMLFEQLGTFNTRCIIIRDPLTKPVNTQQPYGEPNAAMDMRFGPMQYLALKYPKNPAIITTLPYAAITRFFPNQSPWTDYFPHLSLDEIVAHFAAIERACDLLPTLHFDENQDQLINSLKFS